jgi:hypothetical protein
MQARSFCVLLMAGILLATSHTAEPRWLPLGPNTADREPHLTVLSSDDHHTVVELMIPGIELEEVQQEGKTVYILSLSEDGDRWLDGEAPLPSVTSLVATPSGAAVTATARLKETTTLSDYQLRGTSQEKLTDAFYPDEIARVGTPAVLRDCGVVQLMLHPVTYNPMRSELRISTRMVVELNYHGGSTQSVRRPSATFEYLYRSAFSNYPTSGSQNPAWGSYLIITHDDFYDAVQPLAQWRHRRGEYTKVATLSETGSTKEQIYSYVSSAYQDWERPPDYLLLVGDIDFLPTYTFFDPTPPGYFYDADDNYYGRVEGNDYFSDILVGRISVKTIATLDSIVNKIIAYETDPYLDETDWYRRATMVAGDMSYPGGHLPSIPACKLTVRDILLEHGYTQVDTFFNRNYDFPTDQMRDDIRGAVDEGRAFLNYRGSGWGDGWMWSHYDEEYFTLADLPLLQNGRKLPVVMAVGCGAARYNWENDPDGTDPCFGELWLRLGENRGAVALFGPTGNTHTAHNNPLDKGIYLGLFDEGLTTLGQVTYYGKLYLYRMRGHSDTTEVAFRQYMVLGDPALHLWTDVPQTLVVNHADSIPRGLSTFTVAVTGLSESSLEGALVCLCSDLPDTTVYSAGMTNSDGEAMLEITAPEVGTVLHLTVTARNRVPYQGTVTVRGCQISYFSHEVDDSQGNDDGIVNAGEVIVLPVTLKNWCTETSYDVSGVMATTDTYVSIQANTQSYGDIAPDDTARSSGDYRFTVSTDCPDGQSIPFEFDVSDRDGHHWTSHLDLTASASELGFGGYRVDDSLTPGNNNHIVEPGERVTLPLILMNAGSAQAEDVCAHLSSPDSYVTIEADSASFGDIEAEGTAISSPGYIVTIDGQCPDPYLAQMYLTIATGEHTVEDSFYLLIGETSFSDDFEPEPLPGWTHQGTNDLWHISEHRNHSSSHSWYCGIEDEWVYEDDMDASLITPPMVLPQKALLTFWHYHNLEYGCDHARVEINCNGEWVELASFTALSSIWKQYTCDLSAYPAGTTVWFRFHMDTDSWTVSEGWYLDDISVGVDTTGISEVPVEPSRQYFSLSQNCPNPFSGSTALRYSVEGRTGDGAVGSGSWTSLTIYDVAGRSVRRLVGEQQKPGSYTVRWDGRDDTGRLVGAGVYFYRLVSGENRATRKMVMLR